MTEILGRFGHHPDPAIDFCIEVEELDSIVTDKQRCLRTDEPVPTERIERAMAFRVGGDAGAVEAKRLLRSIEKRALTLVVTPFRDLARGIHDPSRCDCPRRGPCECD